MRHPISILCIVLFFRLHSTIATPLSLDIRQNGSPTTAPQAPERTAVAPSRAESSAVPSKEPSATNSPSDRETRTSSGPIASASGSSSPTIAEVSVTSASSSVTPSITSVADSNPLPIHPKITPAVGLAGALLLISGLVYAFIGIRNQWLYVFASAGYLTSLAVTVLIVYLMSPPVSDAVQGAFFVAAFVTGLIFGGLSLVFSDITEGLGCLLGGFCLSMWFLTLKQGGLIGSSAGRAIFISVMSVAGFSLSFSHYTREYGLIVSIAFSGSTITMLGIDCFSKAGWKEFWLYLWGLNSNAFPLHTDTYPITRGIRVEVACVVLFTLFGIISQMRLWKLVKERREKSNAVRIKQVRHTEREEQRVGRKVEQRFARERAQWEATYGDQSLKQDSVMDSSSKITPKTSTSVRERELSMSDSVELVPLPRKRTSNVEQGAFKSESGMQAQPDATVTISVLRDDDQIQQIDARGNPIPSYEPSLAERSVDAKSTNAATPALQDVIGPSTSTEGLLHSPVPWPGPPPVVVQLPFNIPTEDDAQNGDVDNASVSAVPESVQEPIQDRSRFSKRLSRNSAIKRYSTGHMDPDEEEALVVPHIDEDRASSLAATLDDEHDRASLPPLSEHGNADSINQDPITSDTEQVTSPDNDLVGVESPTPRDDEQYVASQGVAALPISGVAPAHQMHRQSLTVSTDPKPGTRLSSQKGTATTESRTDPLVSSSEQDGEDQDQRSTPVKSRSPSMSSRTGSQTGISKENLPDKLSKVALSYRTNEWAKHLELAERPEEEQLPEPPSPGVRLVHFSEASAPITDEIKGIQPAIASKRTSKRASTESVANQQNKPIHSASDMSRASLNPLVVLNNSSRTSVISPSPYNGSRTSPSPGPVNISRTSVSPPVPVHAPRASVISPLPNNTLMGKRESLTRNRASTQSFQNVSSSSLASALDQENMTLAQRKQLIQHQKPPSASQQWRQSSWANGGQTQAFDSHQPKRSSSGMSQVKREDMMASWRESIQKTPTPVQAMAMATATGPGEDERRLAMLNERRHREAEGQRRAMMAQQRESIKASRMRSGEMLDAHREAMRRLQATANKHA